MVNDYTAWAKIKPLYLPEPNFVPSKILQFAPAYHYSYDSHELQPPLVSFFLMGTYYLGQKYISVPQPLLQVRYNWF